MANRKSHLITSFSMDDNQDNRILLKDLEAMAGKDGWSLSKLISEALREYKNMHSPGNPQLILGHWNAGTPLPQTLNDHKHKWMVRSYEKERWFDCECGAQRA